MACIDPGTVSPGYLRLDYVHSSQSLAHSTRARFVLGVDPLDVSVIDPTAIAWAAVWKGIVTSAFVCGGYSVLRPDGTVIYQNSFNTPVAGVHGSASGALDYASRTICFTGKGLPPAAADCSGEAIGRVFVGAAYEFIARQKYMVPGADASVDAYAAFLDANSIIWADEFGQNAGVRPRYPVQFNAYAQGRNGT